MKKILFLLLISVSMYGQTLQNPTFGNTTTNTLKVKTPATVTSVNFLTGFDVDGISLAKIDPVNLPISTATQTALNLKQNTLTNPVTGTGVNGQVSFWNSTNIQTGDNGFIWDNTTKAITVTTSSTTFNPAIIVKNSALNSNSPSFARFITDNGTDGVYFGKHSAMFSVPNMAFITNTFNAPIAFDINSSEKMRLTTSGLGIGVSAPLAIVHANGTTLNTGYFLSKSGVNIGVLAAESTWLGTGISNKLVLSSYGSNLILGTSGSNWLEIADVTGVVKIPNLSGATTEMVVADASGNLGKGGVAPTSGTYTPTLTAGANVTVLTNAGATYTRIGNIVTARVSVTFTTTTGNTSSGFTITLPINRATASALEIGNGSTITGGSLSGSARLSSSNTSIVSVSFISGSGSGSGGSATLIFQYDVTQ